MAQIKTLDEQFAFDNNTPIVDNLNRVLKAIEARLQQVDAFRPVLQDTINNLTAVALQRMNETFTPLILDAQQRLEEFGANFIAHSTTSLTVGLGVKILSLDEADRAGYVYADYVAIRHSSNSEFMIASVNSYDRENGQLFVTSVVANGSGTFADWDITISVQPDLAHETDFDNPHKVTAAQVGAYTTGQTDTALTGLQTALYDYIATFNLATVMRKTENLTGLSDAGQARANIGLPNSNVGRAAIGLGVDTTGKTNSRAIIGTGTSGDSIPVLNAANVWGKPQAGAPVTLVSNAGPDFSAAVVFKGTVNGTSFIVANPIGNCIDNSFVIITLTFQTGDTVSFGNKYKVSGYSPSTSGTDVLSFMRDATADTYNLVGIRNGADQ